MPAAQPDSKWSRSDPERRAAAIAEYRRTYRAAAPATLPPISRQQLLDEDLAQERALVELEVARGSRRGSPQRRLRAYEERERRWIRLTSSRYEIEGGPADDA